jgi:AraC-like DNA-binding protein
MVQTTQIKPGLQLQSFIRCYALREFDTGESTMPMPMHAMNECYMTFFLKGSYTTVVDVEGNTQQMSSTLVSLLTSWQGLALYKGNYRLLSVQFKSNGFFATFGIPQRLLLNSFIRLEDILGPEVYRCLSEKLQSYAGLSEMAICLDEYFIQQLLSRKHKNHTGIIASIATSISRDKGRSSVDQLAGQANMSTRNFERRFIDEVGMSPKLYSRITRFFLALEKKMLYPEKSWTTITYESGYFDQAHFIRECKEFSSSTPEELFQFTPPPTEKFIEKVEF